MWKVQRGKPLRSLKSGISPCCNLLEGAETPASRSRAVLHSTPCPAGFAAVLRAESRQCSPCELFKFDSCAGLAHAIACSTCTSQMPGALTERGDDGSMRPENTSTDRRSSNQSNTALIWRQSSNIAARSFSSGAVLRNSTDALPENPATGLGTPRSAADLASSLAARVHNAGEASSRGRRNAGRPTPSEAKEYMNGVAELEQSVGDPGAEKEHDKWENFVSLVQNRRRAVAPGGRHPPLQPVLASCAPAFTCPGASYRQLPALSLSTQAATKQSALFSLDFVRLSLDIEV